MCARLSGDAAEVQGATGLRIGLILQGTSSVVVGFIMAICYNWKLTLVGTAFLPLVSYYLFICIVVYFLNLKENYKNNVSYRFITPFIIEIITITLIKHPKQNASKRNNII